MQHGRNVTPGFSRDCVYVRYRHVLPVKVSAAVGPLKFIENPKREKRGLNSRGSHEVSLTLSRRESTFADCHSERRHTADEGIALPSGMSPDLYSYSRSQPQIGRWLFAFLRQPISVSLSSGFSHNISYCYVLTTTFDPVSNIRGRMERATATKKKKEEKRNERKKRKKRRA